MIDWCLLHLSNWSSVKLPRLSLLPRSYAVHLPYYLSYQSLLFQHPPRKCVRILHIPAAITSCSDVLPGHHPIGNSRLPWNDKLVATDPLLVPASRRDQHAIDALGNKTLDDWLLPIRGIRELLSLAQTFHASAQHCPNFAQVTQSPSDLWFAERILFYFFHPPKRNIMM